MSLDLYTAMDGFFKAIFGDPFGPVGILPGSIAGLNTISTTMEFS